MDNKEQERNRLTQGESYRTQTNSQILLETWRRRRRAGKEG
jgi:hypothetical protein